MKSLYLKLPGVMKYGNKLFPNRVNVLKVECVKFPAFKV